MGLAFSTSQIFPFGDIWHWSLLSRTGSGVDHAAGGSSCFPWLLLLLALFASFFGRLVSFNGGCGGPVMNGIPWRHDVVLRVVVMMWIGMRIVGTWMAYADDWGGHGRRQSSQRIETRRRRLGRRRISPAEEGILWKGDHPALGRCRGVTVW